MNAWILLSLGLAAPSLLYSQDYELAGQIRRTPLGWTRHFEVQVHGCQWLIRCRPDPSTAEEPYWETAGTGTGEVYLLTCFPTRQWATALVESNVMPVSCEEPATPILWLLLASGCFCRHLTNPLARPVFDPMAGELLDRERQSHLFWEPLPGPPFLPRTVVYWCEGVRRVWNSRTRQAAVFPLPSPYDRGFTNAVGWVLAYTNLSGLVFPCRLAFEEYGLGSDQHHPTLPPRYRIEATVDTIRPFSTQRDSRPLLPYRTSVQDRRLIRTAPDARPISYTIDNGRWPSPRQLRTIQEQQRRALDPDRGLGWFTLLFCLTVLAPLAALWWHRHRAEAAEDQ